MWRRGGGSGAAGGGEMRAKTGVLPWWQPGCGDFAKAAEFGGEAAAGGGDKITFILFPSLRLLLVA